MAQVASVLKDEFNVEIERIVYTVSYTHLDVYKRQTEAIVQELLAAGKSIEDARRGGTSGCVETGAFGNEAYICLLYTSRCV